MGADRPGRLRIVAGNWRSRVLPVADVDGLRPTSERVRETLFNWLGPRIAGQRALDLFAGTGALGFEALSRGAADVVFVEQSAKAVAALRDAADLLDAEVRDESARHPPVAIEETVRDNPRLRPAERESLAERAAAAFAALESGAGPAR